MVLTLLRKFISAAISAGVRNPLALCYIDEGFIG
jgi:hypothetical protein